MHRSRVISSLPRSNVLDAQYPRVDSNSRVQIRFKAPDAAKVKLNFWSGPKVDMEKQADGFWTITTPPMAPGLHYYTMNVDGAEVSDPDSTAYFGGSKWASAVEVPEAGADYYQPKMFLTGRCARSGITRASQVRGGTRSSICRRTTTPRRKRDIRCSIYSTGEARMRQDGSGKGRRTSFSTT